MRSAPLDPESIQIYPNLAAYVFLKTSKLLKATKLLLKKLKLAFMVNFEIQSNCQLGS